MSEQPAISGVVPRGNVSGVVELDGASGSLFSMTLIGNVTLHLQNVKPGQPLFVKITQGGAGGFTAAWSGQTLNTNAFNITPPALAGSTRVFLLIGSATDMSTVDVMDVQPNAPSFGPLHQVLVGDSLEAGLTAGEQAGTTWASRGMRKIRGGTVFQHNFGTPGQVVGPASDPTSMVALYDATVPPVLTGSALPYFHCGGGSNDLAAHRTSAAILADLQSIFAKANVQFGGRTSCRTVPPNAAIVGADETQRLILNAAILAGQTGAAIVIDWLSIPQSLDITNATWYNVNHPTDALLVLWTELAARLWNQFLGFVEPTEPTVTAITSAHDTGLTCIANLDALAGGNTYVAGAVDIALDTSGNNKSFIGANNINAHGVNAPNAPNGRPTVIAQDTDGLPLWRFDGTLNQALLLPSNLLPTAGPYHLIMLVRFTNAGPSGRIWSQSNAGATQFIDGFSAVGAAPTLLFEQAYAQAPSMSVGDPDQAIKQGPNVSNSLWQFCEFINDGTSLWCIVTDQSGERVVANRIIDTSGTTTTTTAIGCIWLGAGGNVFTPRSFDLREASFHTRVLPWNVARDLKEALWKKWSPRYFDLQADQGALASAAFADLITLPFHTVAPAAGRALAAVVGTTTGAGSVANFQMTLDGVALLGGGTIGAVSSGSCSWQNQVAIAPGDHMLKIRYKVGGGGNLAIRPVSAQESASIRLDLAPIQVP